MHQPVSLDALRSAAEVLAATHRRTAAIAALCQEAIRDAIGPIVERYRPELDSAAEDESRAHMTLDTLLAGAPDLFARPRSAVVDGVRYGYKREADGLDFEDAEDVIRSVRRLLADEAGILIRTEESLVMGALEALAKDKDGQAKLRSIGVRLIAGADKRFISVGDADIDKLAKTLLADAAKRQGEEEKVPLRKTTAKAKREKVAA